MSGAYGTLKALRHQRQLRSISSGEVEPPVHLQLIISDLCNQNCSFCSYRMGDSYTNGELFTINTKLASTGTNNPIRFMDKEKCFEILEDCQQMGVKCVEISGGGEPSVHPSHAEIYRKVTDCGLELALITNGLLLTEDAIDSLELATWVRVSIDSGDAKAYAKVRRVSESQFERVWANVARLVKRCSNVEIGLGFVVTDENYSGIGEFIKRASDAGVDNVRLSAFFQKDGASYYSRTYNEIIETIRKAKSEFSRDGFEIYDNFGERVSDLVVGFPDYSRCGFQYFTTYIGADLNMYRCCNLSYAKNGVVGSLRGKRFAELWRETADSRKEFDPSANCPRCRYNSINKNILYMIEPNPKHVNFV